MRLPQIAAVGRSFLRGMALAGAACVVASIGASAAVEGTTPVVSGFGPAVGAAGSVIQLNGNHFSSDATQGDCTGVGGVPQVVFYPLDGSSTKFVPPDGPDSSQCTNTMVKVRIPTGFSQGARLAVQDAGGHTSNSNFQVTMAPIINGLNPAAAGVGASTQVQGNNLHPATVAPGTSVSLTIGGAGRSVSSWSNGGIGFTPGNTTGDVKFTFQVATDSSDTGNTGKRATVSGDAGTYTFEPPVLDGGQQPNAGVGKRITLTGQYLGTGGSVTFAGGVAGASPAWGQNQVQVTIPQGAQSGAINVVVSGYGAVSAFHNGPLTISIDPAVSSVAPTAGSAGTPFTIYGSNFGSSRGTVFVGSTSETVTGWSERTITFTMTGDTDSGTVTVNRPDGAAVQAGTVTVEPRISKVEKDQDPPGSQVVIDGLSLGATTGTVSLGSLKIAPLLWSRSTVLFSVPASLAPGAYRLAVVAANGAVSNSIQLTIVPGPSPSPGATPSAAAGHFDNLHDFVKPPKALSPVELSLDAEPKKIEAGSSVNLTVTLKLNGKAVSGAPVALSMLLTSGEDYAFTPKSGVTDSNGVFKAVLRVSKTGGNNIILAQSGVFSDQDGVQATGGNAPAAATSNNPAGGLANPASLGPFVPFLILGGIAATLVVGGVVLNLRSHV